MKYTVIRSVRLMLDVEADTPERAAKIALDTPLDRYEEGDNDEDGITVTDEDGEEVIL